MLRRLLCSIAFALVPITILLSSGQLDGAFVPPAPQPSQDDDTSMPGPTSHGPTSSCDHLLRVSYDEKLAQGGRARVFRQVRDILNRAQIGVPDDRLRFFRSVIDFNSHPLEGWGALIESITPTEEGTVVQLRVHALLSCMADTVYFIESYSIVDGEVHYLGAIAPPNQSRWQVGF